MNAIQALFAYFVAKVATLALYFSPIGQAWAELGQMALDAGHIPGFLLFFIPAALVMCSPYAFLFMAEDSRRPVII